MGIVKYIQRLFIIFICCGGIFFSGNGEAAFYGRPDAGWHLISSDRYGASYYIPPDYNAEKRWPLAVIIYSNEAQKGPAFVADWLKAVKAGGAIALFVSYLNPRGAPFASDERIFRLMDELTLRYQIDRRRILVTGFGEAAHYAFYLGFHYPKRFSNVAAAGGGAEGRYEYFFDYGEKSAKSIPFLVLYGDRDQTVDKDHFIAAHEALAKRGYQIELEEYEGLGHQPNSQLHERIIDWFLKERTGAVQQ